MGCGCKERREKIKDFFGWGKKKEEPVAENQSRWFSYENIDLVNMQMTVRLYGVDSNISRVAIPLPLINDPTEEKLNEWVMKHIHDDVWRRMELCIARNPKWQDLKKKLEVDV